MLALKRGRRILGTMVLGTIVGTAAACGGGSADSAGSGPFVFYVSIDTSGPTAVLGGGLLAGARTAIKDINAKGGIGGRQIKLEVANDQNNPTKAVSELQRRLAKGKPDLVYPGGSSAVSMSMLPILTRDKVLSVGATSSIQLNDPKKFPYHFGVTPPSSAYVPTFVQLAKEKGYKKVAMIYSDDATGQSSFKQYEGPVKQAGIELVSASYDTTALDMTPQLQQLRAQKPDALIVNGYGTAVLYVLRGRAQIGWTLPSYGDQLASPSPIAGKVTAAQIKNYQVIMQTSSLVGDRQHPGLAPVIKEFQTSDGAKFLTQTGVAVFTTTYDLLQFVAYEAGQEKTTDGQKLAKAFEKFKTPANPPWVGKGPNGEVTKYEYTPSNHFPMTSATSFKYVQPGTYDADGFYVPGKGY
ncbi:ABC transporter substrate-binding protein [Actinomadura syzygii]|uniref:ABC transporter substrate-binding protein n=1 Tax=Actinomadura syzygii TaxID=1427538 RepID=A0A5D0TTH6_9ACTN|nr:ABC transporter substrate-binding protein [Actinomadura syzygii]